MVALFVAGAADIVGCVEHHCEDGHARRARRLDVRLAALTFERGRVGHGGELALEPALDDEVEHGERVLARALIVFAEADDGAQAVGRHHLLRTEPLSGPMRLPRSRRADENQQARIGNASHQS